MSFFDSKEEVINIELTSYGKLLLSRGLMKPVYYSFEDADILYDISYADLNEFSSKSEVRIQEETPYLKPTYSLESPKASLDVDQEDFVASISKYVNNSTLNKLDSSIGESSNYSLLLPSWKIKNLSYSFEKIDYVFNNSNIAIPQLTSNVTCSIFFGSNENQEISNAVLNIDPLNIVYDDKFTYIADIPDLVLKLEEENTDAEYDKFDVEFYKITTNEDGEDTYTKLKTLKVLEQIDDNDLLTFSSQTIQQQNVTDDYIEYYFDVLVDKEISEEMACKHILKSRADQDLLFNNYENCAVYSSQFETRDLYEISVDNATGKVC
jgi:hypothetical protein